ncbi:MAG: hypothetical protein J0M22_18135 [Gammaproteobacteria bacterium]|nr:hypothetical protein [Gammaproteobacteria bacterium]
MSLIELIGYIPAIIFPVATLMQLWHLLKTKTSDGVPPLTWLAFAVGNISLYIYAEKYTELQSILGQLATAALQVYVVVLIYRYRQKPQ